MGETSHMRGRYILTGEMCLGLILENCNLGIYSLQSGKAAFNVIECSKSTAVVTVANYMPQCTLCWEKQRVHMPKLIKQFGKLYARQAVHHIWRRQTPSLLGNYVYAYASPRSYSTNARKTQNIFNKSRGARRRRNFHKHLARNHNVAWHFLQRGSSLLRKLSAGHAATAAAAGVLQNFTEWEQSITFRKLAKCSNMLTPKPFKERGTCEHLCCADNL